MQLLLFTQENRSVVMVGGTNGALTTPFYAVSMDDGDTWSIGTLSGFGSTALTTMNFADGRFLAGTNTAHFFETRDSGTTWNVISVAGAATAAGGVSHADGRYIVHDSTASAGVHTMPDGGSTWTSLGTAGAATSNSSGVLVAGGTLYVLSQANGLYYQASPTTLTQVGAFGAAYSLCTDNGMIYVATASQLYTARVGSTSFAAIGTPFGIAAVAGNNYMACHGSTFVVPVGANCDIAVSTNAGASWSTVNLGCGGSYVTGAAFTGKRYVATTYPGGIYVSDDAVSWRLATLPPGAYTWTGIAANQEAFYY